MAGIEAADRRAEALFRDRSQPEVEAPCCLFGELTTDEAELFGTVYAAWNDLLIDNRPADDAAIVAELYGWHPDKRGRFAEDRVRAMIDTVHARGYAPTGRPPRTLPVPAGPP